MKKRILVLILSAAVLLSGCSAVDAVGELLYKEPDYVSVPAEVDTATCYYYNQLSEPEQRVYACLLSEIRKGNNQAIMARSSYDELSDAMARGVEALLRDFPEFYIYNGGATSDGTAGTGKNRDVTTVTLWKSDAFTGSDTEAEAFEKTLNGLVADAAQCKTPYEQALYVHDYIVSHTDYDQAAADTISSEDTPDSRSFTAYGCLVDGLAVCSGYAKAFQAAMLRLGIPCIYAVGKADGVTHAWNIVCLDGAWCHVDATWDDPSFGQNSVWPDTPMYNYFGLDDSLLPHTEQTMFTVPECSNPDNYYFNRMGLVVDTYSFAAVKKAILSQSGPVYAVKFTTAEAMEEAVEELVESGRWSHISVLRGKSIKYSRDKDTNVLSLAK